MKLKPSITLALILLIFLYLPVKIYPQTAFPRLEPDPKALDYYRLGLRDSYTWTELAQISLWASGDSSLSNLEKISSIAAAINDSSELPVSNREKAEFILTYMHRNVLRRYSLYQTRVDTLLSNGSFNCVSSSALYIILCRSMGINTSAVITKDHAFVMVHIDGQDIDVETTNRFGFDPGNRKEFHDQFGRLTGFSYVPAQNYRDRQLIKNIELISLILNNRIGELERRNNFSGAVPLAVDRAALLLGSSFVITAEVYSSEFLFSDPRKELMDRLLNYGATLLRTNKEEDGIRWALFASSLYPEPNRWNDYLDSAVNNRIARFIKDRKITEAADFLENHKTYITQVNYAQLDSIVIDASLLNRANNIKTAAEGDVLISDINKTHTAGRLTEKRTGELLTYSIQKIAEFLCAPPGRNWRAAAVYLENALSQYGANREIEQALRRYRSNIASDFHNRFAAEWNKKNYEEAELILNEGLAEFPDNRQLLNNRAIVNRHKNQ